MNKLLPPYANSLAKRLHITGNPTASYSMKPFVQTVEQGYWAVRPSSPEQYFQLSSANTSQTLGKLLAQYWI